MQHTKHILWKSCNSPRRKKPLQPLWFLSFFKPKHWTYSTNLAISPVRGMRAQTRPLNEGTWLATAHREQVVVPLAGHQPSQPKRFWTTRISKPNWLGNWCYIQLLKFLLPPLCYMHSFPLCCTELICFISLIPGLDRGSPLWFHSTLRFWLSPSRNLSLSYYINDF